MREILIRHWEHYPGMEAQDLVKLIYQSEFGGGHLIRDPGESLRRLQAEYEDVYKRQACTSTCIITGTAACSTCSMWIWIISSM